MIFKQHNCNKQTGCGGRMVQVVDVVHSYSQVCRPRFEFRLGDVYKRFLSRSRVYGSLVNPNK